MPRTKQESVIFTVMMCFVMVLWMSIYNVARMSGGLSFSVVQQAWMGFPIAYLFAMCCDMLIVSRTAKAFAFRFLIREGSSPLRMVLSISGCMVVCMVLIMSFYGACERCVHTGEWSMVGLLWLQNIPFNFIMALPLQLLIAGPLVRKAFEWLCPAPAAA